MRILSWGTLLVLLAATPVHALDSWNMSQVGYSTMGTPNSAVVNGNIAYVAAGSALLVVDISNPLVPEIVEVVITPGGAKALILHGNYLYSGQGQDGINIYQVGAAEPYLTFAGNEPTSLNAYQFDIEGGNLFVADGANGLLVYSLTNPTNPSLRGTYALPEINFFDVDVVGALAYVMFVRDEWDLFFPGLRVFDVTNPSFPMELASTEFDWQGAPGSVVVDGSFVFVSNGFNSIHVAAYAPPSTLVEINTISAPGAGMVLVGNTLFSSGSYGIAATDVTDPLNHLELASESQGGYSGGSLWTDGSSIVFPVGDQGVVMFDASVPGAIVRQGTVAAPSRTLDVEINDDAVFVADHQTMSLFGSVSPLVVQGVNAGLNNDWDVELGVDGVLFASGAGIRSIDIAQPAELLTLASINPAGQELDLCAVGTTVYSAQSSSGFAITDFADPANPQELGTFTAHSVGDLTASGDFVYSAGVGLIEAVDVSDPTLPLVTDAVPYTSYVGSMHVFYDHLYVAEGTNGVRIFDISTPGTLNEIGLIPAQDGVWDVDVNGVWAWVADGRYVRVYDVGNKASPVEIAYHEAVGTIRSLEIGWNNTVGVAGVFDAGIYLFWPTTVTPVPAATNPSIILQAWPNPAVDRANFAFTLDWNDDVRLGLYDVAGRLVRSWERPATAQQRGFIQWNGCDRSGRNVANGVYFYRLDSSRGARSGSLVLKR